MGLTGPGQILEGRSADFSLSVEDIPDEPEDTEAGRDLPDEVMRELCDNLDLLEKKATANTVSRPSCCRHRPAAGRDQHVGRWTAWRKDPDGTLVLIYDNSKNYRLGRRLPIAKATAAVITDQQERVRERFPDTPTASSSCCRVRWPTPRERSRSVRSATPTERGSTLARHHDAGRRRVDGQLVTKLLPFDKSKIFPYAYRHSFAQRHADATSPRTCSWI